MADFYRYPQFQYHQLTHFQPPGESAHLFYQDLLCRFFAKTTVIPVENDHLDPCWGWKGNDQWTLSHKYMGMVSVFRLAATMHLPEDMNHLIRISNKRLNVTYKQRCGNNHCVRPDHIIPIEGPTYHAWMHQPRQRNPKYGRDEWLSYTEQKHLEACIRCGAGSPERTIHELAERIALPFTILADIWELTVDRFEQELADSSTFKDI